MSNLEDWEIERNSNFGNRNLLFHKCHGSTYCCAQNYGTRWKCDRCEEEAPEVIQQVALLCGCIKFNNPSETISCYEY